MHTAQWRAANDVLKAKGLTASSNLDAVQDDLQAAVANAGVEGGAAGCPHTHTRIMRAWAPWRLRMRAADHHHTCCCHCVDDEVIVHPWRPEPRQGGTPGSPPRGQRVRIEALRRPGALWCIPLRRL
jgi:hypothetical protein